MTDRVEYAVPLPFLSLKYTTHSVYVGEAYVLVPTLTLNTLFFL